MEFFNRLKSSRKPGCKIVNQTPLWGTVSPLAWLLTRGTVNDMQGVWIKMQGQRAFWVDYLL